MKTVREILASWLHKHGYDGLYADTDCACLIDDLMPCNCGFDDCAAGHRGPCDCGDHEYHIRAEKPGG